MKSSSDKGKKKFPLSLEELKKSADIYYSHMNTGISKIPNKSHTFSLPPSLSLSRTRSVTLKLRLLLQTWRR